MGPAIPASRDSRPTSASTTARPSTSRSTTDSTDYRLDIYRLGYYGGDGARKVATVQPSAPLPQTQPACVTEPTTGLVDCGNWAVSASWAVPADAVSGIYIAKLVREDRTVGQAATSVFVVRDDGSHSDLLFQTSDTTWQAYNHATAATASTPVSPARARAGLQGQLQPPVHHPRHARRQDGSVQRRVPDGPLARAQRLRRQLLHRRRHRPPRHAEILNHKVFLSVGHDEYWSGAAARQRRGGARRRA